MISMEMILRLTDCYGESFISRRWVITNFSELKKKEADRTQLIINNKHILKRQEYTINLLLKEREEVIKNLGMLLNNITDQKVLHFS